MLWDTSSTIAKPGIISLQTSKMHSATSRFPSQWDLVPPHQQKQPSLTGNIRSRSKFSYSNCIRSPGAPNSNQHGKRTLQPDQSERLTNQRPYKGDEQQQNDGQQQQKYSLGEERLWQLLPHPWVPGGPQTQL